MPHAIPLTKLETIMVKALRKTSDPDVAEARILSYHARRQKVLNEVCPHIPAAEPGLTDHSAKHIKNVLDNALHLLGEPTGHLRPPELFILCQAILFHDVGNVTGRENHHQRIGPIFDWASSETTESSRERLLITKVAAAHTGLARDRSRDTLRDVPEQDHLGAEAIRLQQLAAILRLADELAEGPTRASTFLLENELLAPSTRIFHEYAKATQIWIDRPGQALKVTHDIKVGNNWPSPEEQIRIKELTLFAVQRFEKLNDERVYTRFYSELLDPFRRLSMQINFHYRGQVLEPYPMVTLDDKRVPESRKRTSDDLLSHYGFGNLCSQLDSAIEKGALP